MRRIAALLVVLAAVLGGAGAAAGASLRIGVSAETTSIDPHFQDIGPNYTVKQHLFDSLVHAGPNQALEPGLATAWKLTDDPHVWEIALRRGVRFHDGSPFTAADAVFSLRRAPDVPNAPSTLKRHLEDIAAVEAVDDFTLRIRTKLPLPTLPNNLVPIGIVSRAIGERAEPGGFNTGRFAIGTGPFRFVEWVAGSHIKLAANPDYWGGKPAWDEVMLRPITNAGARVAALLAGDVDVIADVPPIDAPRLSREPTLAVARGLSSRVIFWSMDVHRETTPHVTAKDGTPIANPLRDLRVRRAIALVLDRGAIVRSIMDGLAEPATQIVPPGLPGHRADIRMPEPDLAAARRLMAEAGHANGFKMTIHVTANRYPNDLKQAQAIAQMLSRLNIEVNVASLPLAIFFTEARKFEFSFNLVGWGFVSGDPYVILREALQTGAANNYGRWSNAEADRLLAAARVEMDRARRDAALVGVQRLAIEDLAVIPTHFQVNVWASRKGFAVTPRMDESTLAHEVKAQ
ncbi:MAG: ABC transporter substrate-binding protein [Alphaproteobacteria bacterium]|nr:ABC transporter substrate-binding protein [Alphaproteobacteria bacterium]